MQVIDEMASRFLTWHLPAAFMPDGGVSFTPVNHPTSWPTGTNLLTGEQAKQMLEHVARDLLQMLADCDVFLKDGETPAQRIERERRDTDAVLTLLVREKQKTEALHAALREAYDLREALCRNSDDNHTPMDPLIYDKPLQAWAPLLKPN